PGPSRLAQLSRRRAFDGTTGVGRRRLARRPSTTVSRAALSVGGPRGSFAMSAGGHTEPAIEPSRRHFLFGLGVALNALAAALFAIPVVGYILSPARRFTWLAWTSLGPVTAFPENQTRLATYRNPFVKPWDGETAKIPCWVQRLTGESFQIFAINCTHLG